MDVALVKSEGRTVAIVEVPEGYAVDFIRHLYAQGEGLNVDGLTADHCFLIPFDSLRQKIEPCAPNMTLFFDANSNEIIVERLDEYNFKFNGERWTINSQGSMYVLLSRLTGTEGRDELAKRLLALPLPG